MVIVVFCLTILLVILGIRHCQKNRTEHTPNSKDETSMYVDDTSKETVVDDETQNSEVQNGETETWIEPSGESEELKNHHSNNDVASSPETDDREVDKQQNKKPEWIGGDF